MFRLPKVKPESFLHNQGADAFQPLGRVCHGHDDVGVSETPLVMNLGARSGDNNCLIIAQLSAWKHQCLRLAL